MRGEEAHYRSVCECRLGQIEHKPRTEPPDLRLYFFQVILFDPPTEPQHRGLTVGCHFDFQGHRGESDAIREPRQGKGRAKTNRLGVRELVFSTLPTDWQLPKD